MDGLLCIDKHPGPTSHDIVAAIRKILRIRKAGHCGTLDPAASGVLLVALGRAARLSSFLSRHDKTYSGTIRLGFSTDTYDASGHAISEICSIYPTRHDIEQAMREMEGDILQVPPPFSAKKVAGVRSYELARKGKPVDLHPVPVSVRAFKLREYSPPFFHFETRCSAGTYVRSLAHDLGVRLSCGAHLTELVRTASGPFILPMCVSLTRLHEAAAAGEVENVVIPLEEMLPEIPAVVLDEEAAARASHGSGIAPPPDVLLSGVAPDDPDAPLRLFGPDGSLIALARRTADGSSLQPFLVLRPAFPPGSPDS